MIRTTKIQCHKLMSTKKVLSCGKSCKLCVLQMLWFHEDCHKAKISLSKNYQQNSKLIDESTCSWDRHLRSTEVYFSPINIMCVFVCIAHLITSFLHSQILTSISSRGPRHVHPFISIIQVLLSERNSF